MSATFTVTTLVNRTLSASLAGLAAGPRRAAHSPRLRAGDAGERADHRPGVPFTDKELRQIYRDLYGSEPFYGEEQRLKRDELPMILQRALEGERKRGAAGHWSYVRARHINLAKWVRRYDRPKNDFSHGLRGSASRQI